MPRPGVQKTQQMDYAVSLPLVSRLHFAHREESQHGRAKTRAVATNSEIMTDRSANRKTRVLRAVVSGLVLTLLQLFVAVVLIAPAGPFSYRYTTLVQHDSYWFANIVDRGYQTILPPIARKTMEVSNVAFFPAYPAMASVLHRWIGLGTSEALLVVAQAATWGYWTYFFLF